MVFDRLKIERDIPYDIDTGAVYALLGYKKGRTRLPQKMVDQMEHSFREAGEWISPVGVYVVRRIREKRDPITLHNSAVKIKGQSAQNLLKNSFAVIFMAVTIGPGLETRISRYTEEKQFEKTLILDAIGSESAEAAADAVNNYLQILARQTKASLTRRYSPGYGDLPLDFQKDMYTELSLDSLGVSIDENSVLFPRKTVTALIGVEE